MKRVYLKDIGASKSSRLVRAEAADEKKIIRDSPESVKGFAFDSGDPRCYSELVGSGKLPDDNEGGKDHEIYALAFF